MASFRSFTHSLGGRILNHIARTFVPYKRYPVDPKVDARKQTNAQKLDDDLKSRHSSATAASTTQMFRTSVEAEADVVGEDE